MEDKHSETDEVLPATEMQDATISEIGPHDSTDDLNEVEKLQVSSDLPNDVDDDDEEIVATIQQRKKKRALQVLDSDSENDESEAHFGMEGADVEQATAAEDGNNTLMDEAPDEPVSEEENAEKPDDDVEEKRLATKYKSIIDSDTESEPENAEQNEESSPEEESEDEQIEANNTEKVEKRSEVPKRMSAKQAMEQMKAIKSESQRLHRENYVTIPYHQPKQFSLKEFMNRKTICKPNLKEPQKRFSLKMSQDELEEFAKKLEEREKEANDFFKSEDRTPQTLSPDHNKIDSIDCGAEEKVDLNIVHEEEKVPFNPVDRKSEDEIQGDVMNTQGTSDEIIPRTEEDVSPTTEDKQIQSSEQLTTDSVLNTIFAAQSEDQFVSETYESLVVPETEESVLGGLTQEELPANSSEINKPAKVSTVEVIQEVLKERNAIESPSLKGSPRMLIDLETGDVIPPKLTGPERLLERFLKHAKKKKPKDSTSMSIVSTENGQIEVTRVDVAMNEEEITEQKPGAAYIKLKDNLMKVIMKRRKEELQKRVDENKTSDKENKEGYEDELNEEEEYCSDEEEEFEKEDVEKPPPIEVDENEEIIERGPEQEKMQQNDIDADADDEYDSDESGSSSDDEENDDDDEDDDLSEETKAVKTRIIKAFDDSDDENERPDELSSQLDSAQKNTLWQDGEKRDIDGEDELLGLCSGNFETTQKNYVISQIPTTQPQEAVDDNELLALCSGTFQEGTQAQTITESQIVNSPVIAFKRLESSDEENEEGHSKVEKSRHKTTRKLGFSDDEDEEETKLHENEEVDGDEYDEEVESKDMEEEKHNEEEDLPETYIDYDSEENEIEVQLTKNGRREKATEFLENEAELSESEWGSADEDEKDLDRYEIDLADEEQFDRAKLQSELGKIHMRHIMDDDIREVKKLQEMLIEDEETDGIGRKRKFRWQFMDEDFNFERRADVNREPINMDDDDEVAWRKMQYERELLLEKNADKLKSSELTLESSLTGSTGKRITIVNANTEVTTVSESSSPFLIAKTINLSRGSFLMRDSDTLSKLANITKMSGEQEAGAVRPGKAQNFVFASVNTPHQEKFAKRKLAIKDESIFSQKKKRRKFRLIDQLA